MLVLTDLGPKKVGPKNVGLKRINLGTNKFWVQQILFRKKLGQQIYWVPKKLGPKTFGS